MLLDPPLQEVSVRLYIHDGASSTGVINAKRFPLFDNALAISRCKVFGDLADRSHRKRTVSRHAAESENSASVSCQIRSLRNPILLLKVDVRVDHISAIF